MFRTPQKRRKQYGMTHENQKEQWKEEAKQLKNDLKKRKKVIKKRKVELKLQSTKPKQNQPFSPPPQNTPQKDQLLRKQLGL